MSRDPEEVEERRRSAIHQRPWLAVTPPTHRRLQVYATDPSGGTYVSNRMVVQVPWEPLQPGPVGSRFAVVDYDATNKQYYPPVNLDDPLLLARSGLDPSESDPRFHQQMVYAVASKTLHMFEVALGRRLHWRRADRGLDPAREAQADPDDIWVLNLYPHAMLDANAYYSRSARGILFGYFAAAETGQGRNLPGQRVFTCLSHDIIAHEVTHAIIDGIRAWFTEPSNPDVLAFHEGYADLAALFAHFSTPEALVDVIRRTGGRLYDASLSGLTPTKGSAVLSSQLERVNPLIQLAQQFGEARGGSGGLRSALGSPPNPSDLHRNVNDPHFRGSILVAAVFDAYFTVYGGLCSRVFAIYRAGGGELRDDLPEALANELANIAAETARRFFTLCARALEYCPPVDVTFGDFLRSLITASGDLDARDKAGVRPALMEAFRLRGIFPHDASFFSEDALRWPEVPRVPPTSAKGSRRRRPDGGLPAVGQVDMTPGGARRHWQALVFGGPTGLSPAEKAINARVLRGYVEQNARALDLDPELPFQIPSFHPMFLINDEGELRIEMVVEVLQTRDVSFDAGSSASGSFPLRGGVTLIVSAPRLEAGPDGVKAGQPHVRFVISRPLHGDEGKVREQNQRKHAIALGLANGDTTDAHHFQADFRRLHQER